MKKKRISPQAERASDFTEPIVRYGIELRRLRRFPTEPRVRNLQNATGGGQRQRGERQHSGGPAAAKPRCLDAVLHEMSGVCEAVPEGMEGSVIGRVSDYHPGAVAIDEGAFRSIDAKGVTLAVGERIVDGGAGRDRRVDVVTIGPVELVWLESACERAEKRVGKNPAESKS